jgi:hypothetical protein
LAGGDEVQLRVRLNADRTAVTRANIRHNRFLEQGRLSVTDSFTGNAEEG